MHYSAKDTNASYCYPDNEDCMSSWIFLYMSLLQSALQFFVFDLNVPT